MASILLPTKGLNINAPISSAISGRTQKSANIAQEVNTNIPFTVSPSRQLKFAEGAIQVIDEWESRTRQNKLNLLANQAQNEMQKELNDNLVSYRDKKGQNAIDGYNDFLKKNKDIKERYNQIFNSHEQANYDFAKRVNNAVNNADIEGKNYYSKIVSEVAQNESFNKVKESLNTATLNYNSPNRAIYEKQVEDDYSDYLSRYEGITKGSSQEITAQRELKDQYVASAIAYQISTKQYGLALSNLENEKANNLSSITYWRLKSRIEMGLEAERQSAQSQKSMSMQPLTFIEELQAIDNLTKQNYSNFIKNESVVNGALFDVLNQDDDYQKQLGDLKNKLQNNVAPVKKEYIAEYNKQRIDEFSSEYINKNKEALLQKSQNIVYQKANELAKRQITQEQLVRKANANDKIAMPFYYAKQIVDYMNNNQLTADEMTSPLKILDKITKGKGGKELFSIQIASIYGADANAQEQFNKDLLGMLDIMNDPYRNNNDDLLTKSSDATIKKIFADENGEVSVVSVLNKAKENGYKFSASALNSLNYGKINSTEDDNSNLSIAKKVVNNALTVKSNNKKLKIYSNDIAKYMLNELSTTGVDLRSINSEDLQSRLTVIANSDNVLTVAKSLDEIATMAGNIIEDLEDDNQLNPLYKNRLSSAQSIVYQIGLQLYERTGEIPSEETLLNTLRERDASMKSPNSVITNFNTDTLQGSYGNLGGYK